MPRLFQQSQSLIVYAIRTICDITRGQLHGPGDGIIRHLLTDSRSIHFFSESVFFALVTPRNNGHRYIAELYKKGVRCFVVSEKISFETPGASVIHVSDTLKALHDITAYHRSQFHLPVVAITGSNGKTIVKEWLYQLLKDQFTICRSPKSYNSQIGVPLSIWNLNERHTLGIFEAGISTVHEMQMLEQIIKPTIGVFTGLGNAHQEGFASAEEKLAEKFKLFESCSYVVVQGLKRNEIPAHISMHELIFVSEHEDADVRIEKVKSSLLSSSIRLNYRHKIFQLEIPFTDKASVINASTCFGALVALHQNPEDLIPLFRELQPVALRLEIRNGISNSVLINDFYNSDIDSFIIALSYLNQQSLNQKKIVIISDIEQSGRNSDELYNELAALIQPYGIDTIIGVGQAIHKHASLFGPEALFFNSTNDLIAQLPALRQRFFNSTILLKGARSFGFEKISQALQQKSHDTVLEIDLGKLVGNINYYKSLLKSGTGIMCMVKAMGYGSGSVEIAKTLQHVGAAYLAVAYADEGVELRNANINLPVMVMSPERDSFEDIINYQLEPEIYSFKILDSFCAALDRLGHSEPYPVHIKIDTGMRRLGFEEKDLGQLLDRLAKAPQIVVKSVFSHLVGSDNPAIDEFTHEQISIFKNCFRVLEDRLGYSVIRHICNSGGISRFPEAHFDMVRLGIGMYGVGIHPDEQKQLQNVGSLKTTISQLKSVGKGQTVGYNRNGKMEKDAIIATIPIGYADGFRRELGNGNISVYIHGKPCKTVGNICMDMCMIDVTGVDCSEGDEVIIFESFEQIKRIADAEHTIPYELLTSLSSRIKRVYIQE